MKPADDLPPIQPVIEPLVALLELTASYRPELLPWLLSFLPHSPAGYMLEQLAGEWEVRPGEVHRCVEVAARELDRLEMGGDGEPYRMPVPDLAVLCHFAMKRCERVSGGHRRARLKSLVRQVGSALKVNRRRRKLRGYVPETKGSGIDKRWIVNFLGG